MHAANDWGKRRQEAESKAGGVSDRGNTNENPSFDPSPEQI